MTEPAPKESCWRRWVVKPVNAQLAQGTSPTKISLAIACGVTTGVFPLLGTTAFLALGIGILLKLNQPVLHVFRELVYPVQLGTILLFMKAGEDLFGVKHVPLSIPMMLERFFTSPGRFITEYGIIGCYAVVVWLLLAPLLLGTVYFISRPLVARLHSRMAFSRHDA